MKDLMSRQSRRRPLKTVCLSLSDPLRTLLLKLSIETARPIKDILNDLLLQAAGGKIHWITIKPQCGENAGVSLARANELLEKTFFRLRDAKGLIARGGSDEQYRAISDVMTQALELWTHSQYLARATFYGFEQIQVGRAAHHELHGFIERLKKQEAEELDRKEKADAKVIEGCRARITRNQLILDILTRLGFSPEGTHRAD